MKIILSILFSLVPWIPLSAQKLTIYTEVSPPNQVMDAEGRPAGYAVELVRELQKRTGNTDVITVIPWVRAYNEALIKPDIVLFSMARSAERDPLFHWVGPVSESSYMFYVRSDSKVVIRNLEDARKLARIGVYKEDIRDQYLTRLGFTNLDRSVNQEIMLKKVMAGRIDAIVSSTDGIAELVRSAGFKPKELKGAFAFQRVQTYIAISKNTQVSTVTTWKKALESMHRDGSFEAIFRKYHPSLPLPGPAAKPF